MGRKRKLGRVLAILLTLAMVLTANGISELAVWASDTTNQPKDVTVTDETNNNTATDGTTPVGDAATQATGTSGDAATTSASDTSGGATTQVTGTPGDAATQATDTAEDTTTLASGTEGDVAKKTDGDEKQNSDASIEIDKTREAIDDTENGVDTEKELKDAIVEGATINLTGDITVDEEVYILNTSHVTINGNGHTITASESFHVNSAGQINLFKIQSDNVTLNNVKLVTTTANKHALDIWGSKDVVLNNVTLNHTNASEGAPLVINGSSVTVTGKLDVVAGENSWYGINVDINGGSPSLNFATDAMLNYNFPENKVAIYVQNVSSDVIINSGLVVVPVKAENKYFYAFVEEAQALASCVAKIDNTYYATLQEALTCANSGETIILVNDSELNNPLEINKKIILDGQSKYSIKASDNFLGSKLIELQQGADLTVKNVELNAKEKGRVIYAPKGILRVDGATITGGKVSNNYVAGIYMTGGSSFEMTSGNITGNKVEGAYATDQYLQYTADLWIGANASGCYTNITGGIIGNAFVNANEYSENNPGSFTMTGGTIENLYVEYDEGYGGTFQYNAGTVNNLRISTTKGNGDSVKVSPLANTNYKGGIVAQIGSVYYTSLSEAIQCAKSGETVKLLADASVKETIRVDDNRSITIDLNGNNVNAPEISNQLFLLSEGSLKVTGKGKLESKGDIFKLEGNIVGLNSDRETKRAEVYIDKEVEVISTENCCIYIIGKGAKADVFGNLKSLGEYATIQGNGSYTEANNRSDTVINIYPGAVVGHEGGMAIYHPQYGTLNITGGTIVGNTTGIEMRAGKLSVSGDSVITGNGIPVEITPNGNGSTTEGAGIAVAQHTTKLPLEVEIKGGTISGFSAIYQSNPQNNPADAIAKVKLVISGGNFKAINGGTKVLYSENCTNFVSGGYFTNEVDTQYIINEKACVKGTYPVDGFNYSYTIGEADTPIVEIKPGDTTGGISNKIKEDYKEDAANIKTTIKADDVNMAESVANLQRKLATDTNTQTIAEQKYEEEIGVIPAGKTVSTVVVPYLDITVKEMDPGEQRVVLDIKMLYDIKATTDPENLASDETVTIASGKVENPQPTVISFRIPADIFNNGDLEAGEVFYIEHIKDDGSKWYHNATLTDDIVSDYDEVSFLNDKGYSEFGLYKGVKPADQPVTRPGSGSGSGSNSSNTETKEESATLVQTIVATGTKPASTGDSANTLGYVALILVAGAAFTILYFKKKKA